MGRGHLDFGLHEHLLSMQLQGWPVNGQRPGTDSTVSACSALPKTLVESSACRATRPACSQPAWQPPRAGIRGWEASPGRLTMDVEEHLDHCILPASQGRKRRRQPPLSHSFLKQPWQQGDGGGQGAGGRQP